MSAEPAREPRRANDIDGAEWTRASISVWSDIRKTPEETALRHPAMFPTMLARRVVRCFTRASGGAVLDPFAGSGSTMVAAFGEGRRSVGVEVAPEYVALCKSRLDAAGATQGVDYDLHQGSAGRVSEWIEPESIGLVLTSPPYWDILAQRRTADYRPTRDYAGAEADLSRIPDYDDFLEALSGIFLGLLPLLQPGGYCVINVMDLRKKDRFFPLHSDLAARLCSGSAESYLYDDLIVWDRRADYNRLRPLGYPAVFRVNKVHEFLLILRRPPANAGRSAPARKPT